MNETKSPEDLKEKISRLPDIFANVSDWELDEAFDECGNPLEVSGDAIKNG